MFIEKKLTKDAIVRSVLQWAKENNVAHNQVYVGITEDAKQRIYYEHKVTPIYGLHTRFEAITEKDARDAENVLINQYKFWGGTGGGDKPTIVYAYVITESTKESDDIERQKKIKDRALKR